MAAAIGLKTSKAIAGCSCSAEGSVSGGARLSSPLPAGAWLVIAIDKAELVSLRVRHESPAISVLVVVLTGESFSAEIRDSERRSIDILDGQVKMHAIFCDLRLGHPLKAHPRSVGRPRREVHILRRAAKPILHLDAKQCTPERSKALRIMAIRQNPTKLCDWSNGLPGVHPPKVACSGSVNKLAQGG
jgi:hypothetical protein